MTKRDECLKAIQCLYLEVDATIAGDVKQKVLEALNEALKISCNPVLSEVPPSDQYRDIEADGITFCGKCGSMKAW